LIDVSNRGIELRPLGLSSLLYLHPISALIADKVYIDTCIKGLTTNCWYISYFFSVNY